MKLYTFRTVRLSIIRSLFTVHSAVVYVIQVCRQLSSRTRMERQFHILLLSVQWINSWLWTDELSETCRVSCQNKFVKLLHLVGVIIKKFVTMHGHMNVKTKSHRLYLLVSIDSHNRQPVYPRTTLTCWSYKQDALCLLRRRSCIVK